MPDSTSPMYAPDARHPGTGALLRTVIQLVRGIPRRGEHATRLERFYAPQAESYDAFRETLLHGSGPLVEALPPLARGSVLVELGCGTGRNLSRLGWRIRKCDRVELVDLCPSLLAIATRRARDQPRVHVVCADATTYRPSRPADCVLLSYALTMIPDWRAAVDNAVAMLRPGGVLAVTDFYVSQPRPAAGLVRHGWAARTLWPLWFGHDGVRLDPEHLPYLCSRLDVERMEERLGRIPLLPGLRAPYYVFIGRKKAGDAEPATTGLEPAP
jgi:S-adenosylmethionine-diacylgycerolhomoserine-N-methlytransferase